MRCFEHMELEAVGVCKSCGKGICRQCATDLGRGLACSGRCDSHVRALIGVEMNTVNAYQTTKKGYYWNHLFGVALGLIFIIAGLIGGKGTYFAVALGGVMMLFGTISWIRAARFVRALK